MESFLLVGVWLVVARMRFFMEWFHQEDSVWMIYNMLKINCWQSIKKSFK